MPETKTYAGGCHCGNVRYEVKTNLGQVVACNCSICTKRGFLWIFAKPQQFTLRKGEDGQAEYLFNKHIIHHLFCKECGVESYARGKGPDGSDTVAINVRCLDGVDLAALKTVPLDGKSL